jgi:hypothetical protein
VFLAQEIGATSLYLLYAWLLSSIIASDISRLKGHGERLGLSLGLLLALIAVVVMLAWPAKRGSLWQRYVKPVDLLMAVAGYVLFLALLFNWFSVGATKLNFFDEFKVWDLFVPLGAAAAVVQLHMRGNGRAPGWLGTAAVGTSAMAVAMCIHAIVTPFEDGDIEMGAYIGLVAAIVMLVSAVLAMLAERRPAPEAAELVAVVEAEEKAADAPGGRPAPDA